MAVVKADPVQQLAKFLNDSNGRDKLSKFIQYGSRLLMWHYLSADPKSATGEKFKGLFAMTRDSRKLIRLFKYINEIATMQDLLKKGGDPVDQALNLVSRFGWGQYWFFDNLVYLQKAKVYQTTTDVNYYGMLGWFVALLTGIIVNLRQYAKAADEEAAALAKYRVAKEEKSSEAGVAEARKRLTDASNKRIKLLVTIAGSTADLIVASNGIQLPQKVLGHGLNDGVLGFLGCTSAVIAGYYRWKDLNN